MRRDNYPPMSITHDHAITEDRLHTSLNCLVCWNKPPIDHELITRQTWAIGIDLFWGVGQTIFRCHRCRRGRTIMKLTTNAKCFQLNEHQATHKANQPIQNVHPNKERE